MRLQPVSALVGLATLIAVLMSSGGAPADTVPRPRLKPVPPVKSRVRPPEPATVQSEAVPSEAATSEAVPSEALPRPPEEPPENAPSDNLTVKPDIHPPSAEEAAFVACLDQLRAAGADVTREEPVDTERGCKISDPVALSSVRSGGDRVTLVGGPVLNCQFALTVTRWMGDLVSPISRHHLGKPVDKVHVGPGYVCRGRNGAKTGKLSEHAFGNAIDILGLTLKGGSRVMVIDYPTAKGPEKAFLRAMRTSACGYFTTVLGPGADEAHHNHFHVDLRQRGEKSTYRICE